MLSRTGTLTANPGESRWLLLVVAVAMMAALAGPLAPARAQDVTAGGLVEIVPDSALVYLEANLDTTTEQAQLAADLFQRAGIADALEESADTDEIPANTQIGVVVTSIPDVESLDEVSDVTMDPMAATESLDEGGFAVIVGGEGTAQALEEERSSMQENVDQGYGEVTETQYGGVTITVFESTDEFTDSSAIAEVGEYVIFGMRAEDLHPLIDTFNGDAQSLSTGEQFQQVMGLLPTEFLANGWIDGAAILESVRATSPEALETVDPQSLAALDAITGFTFSAEQQGFRLETRSIPNGETAAEAAALDGSFLENVPADSLFVTNGSNIDQSGLVTMLAFLFAGELVGEDVMATPVDDIDLQQSQDDVFAEAESLLGFNLKTDFIDNLVGEFGIALSLDDITAEVPTIEGIIVSDITNPAVVADVMSKISFIVGAGLGDQASIETVDVNGSAIYQVTLTEEQAGIDTKVEFGVLNDEEMVISIGSGLDSYVAGAPEPLAQDEHFGELMANLPSDYTTLTYIDVHGVVTMATQFSEGGAMGGEDADPSCGEFSSQAAAQEAYDADSFENFLLDQDFDGEACEDFPYGGATPSASPVAAADPYANLHGLATVASNQDGIQATSSFLLIGGE